MNELHYKMLIEWSDADRAYLVTLPEWADYNGFHNSMPVTHGKTYSEAAQRGQEVLEMFIESAIRNGEPLPPPMTYAA
jgi:antitoxin HicB